MAAAEPFVNPAPADTKEANEMTETTILNPASIKFALAAKNNELMHKIFRFYQSKGPAPTSATAPQAGGGKRRKSRKRSKRLRKRRKTRQARRR